MNQPHFKRIWFIWWVAFFGLLFAAKGVLPPSEYEKMQVAAPEAVQIEVMAVLREPGEELNEELIRITAVATEVERSASGIQKGDFLQIVYTVRTKPDGLLGREEIPVLTEGTKTIAFLRSEEGTPFFVPAAGAMSFDRF
jgi:hypothetical protein